MDGADALQSAPGVLGIVALVAGLLVWAIKKLVDMFERQIEAQAKSFAAFATEVVSELKRTREELAGLKMATQQMADRVEQLVFQQGEVTPPPRMPRIRER